MKKKKRSININHLRLREDLDSIFLPLAQSEEVKAWVSKNLYNWLYHSAPVRPILGLPENPPEWLITKFMAGNSLYEIRMENDLISQIAHSIDYLNEHTVSDRVSVEDTLKKASDWSLKIEIETKNMEGEGAILPIYAFENGYQFVKLVSKDSFTRESDLMGHCVGTSAYYYTNASRGSIFIYSLRDEKNNPHTTFEVTKEGKIVQIQGKNNQQPIPRYLNMVADFISVKGEELNIVPDNRFCKLLGLIKMGEKFLTSNKLPDYISLSGDIKMVDILSAREGKEPRGVRIHGSAIFKDFNREKVSFDVEAHTIDLSDSSVAVFEKRLRVKVLKASYSNLKTLPSGLETESIYWRGMKASTFPEITVSNILDLRKSRIEDKKLPKLTLDTLDIRGSNIEELSPGTKIVELWTGGRDIKIPDDCEIEMRVN